MRAQLEEAQRQVIELRTAQILEIEEVRLNCQVELLQQKKEKPVTIVKDDNGQVQNLQSELAALELSLEKEQARSCNLEDEVRMARDALADLREELCQPQVSEEIS